MARRAFPLVDRATGSSAPVDVGKLTTRALLRRCRKMTAVFARRGAIAGAQYARSRISRQEVDGAALSRQFRLALGELGPTFVKLGQLLSSRSDLIPPSLQRELSTLRDRAPAIPRGTLMAELEQRIGRSGGELFVEFETVPVACASVAQVHRAVLADGRRVAVKVRRPGALSDIELDVALLRAFSRVLLLFRRTQEYDPRQLVDEFASLLLEEVDFTLEARNIEAIGRTFANDNIVTVPRLIEEVSGESILTMDWVEGIPLTDGGALDAADIDRAGLARAIVHAYATMIFRSDRFQADPHPGNLIAMSGGGLGLVDFGEVGSVAPSTRGALMSLLTAVIGRNSDALAAAVLSFSRPTRSVDRSSLGVELATLLGPITEGSLQDLKLGQVLHELLRVLHNHGLVLPADLAVLIKTVIVCEATAEELEPTIDIRSFLGDISS
jgi:ubiquinone biosynthesis protein